MQPDRIMIDDRFHVTLGFALDPALDQPWTAHKEGEYASGGYRLRLAHSRDAGFDIVDFELYREDGQVFRTLNYEVKALMPAVDVYNVAPRFMGYAHVSHLNGPEILTSSTTKDFPYVIYASRTGENRLAIGLENLLIETLVTRSGKGGHMYYDTNRIEFKRPVAGVTLNRARVRDAVLISTERDSWFDVTRAYWDIIDARRGFRPNRTPPSAYGPCWCSWLYLTDIDEAKIWDSVVAAKDLGIKTIMIDAGWFAADTDIPFPESPLTSDTFGFGRVSADTKKFPDMKALVQRIHEELGLFVWAWATPRWVFRAQETGEKAVDKELMDCRIRTEAGEVVPLLCTRTPGTWEHAARFTAHLIREYGFDGLKFDCWELDEGMAVCCADHKHAVDTMGEGTNEWAARIFAAMTEVNPDAVVWFNNTTMKQHSNYSVSPNEVYCQPDENWRMSVVLKTYTRGIVSQLCEGSWHVGESDANVSRQMAILMMGHVPELQVDLTLLPESHKRIVRAWLAFYEQNREALLYGDYEPFGFEYMMGGAISTTTPHVRIDAGDTAFVWLGPVRMDALELRGETKRLYLFNEQNLDAVRFDAVRSGAARLKATVRGFEWEVLSTREIAGEGGSFRIDMSVPVGGILELEFIDQ